MATKPPPRKVSTPSPISPRTRLIGFAGTAVMALVVFMIVSVQVGGHMVGPTHVDPGNIGLVIDNYHGIVEKQVMPAGTHWQGLWETVIEVPTSQRTITLDTKQGDAGHDAVAVNTISNMLKVDVSAQYQITEDRARDLYGAYQDQFANQDNFENVNLVPSLKGAVNAAIGDMDTATVLTTIGKQQAEREALKALNDEWGPRGIQFSNLMIRGIEQDDQSKALLSTTLAKMQDIENAKLGLQQQIFDNATLLQSATAEARVNQLQNSTLTDLYVQDQLLGKVKRLYLPSDQIMGAIKP